MRKQLKLVSGIARGFVPLFRKKSSKISSSQSYNNKQTRNKTRKLDFQNFQFSEGMPLLEGS